MKHELIGKEVEVKYHNKTFRGVIVDETKNTLCLRTEKKELKLLKNAAVISLNSRLIHGENIMKRPEERIKSC